MSTLSVDYLELVVLFKVVHSQFWSWAAKFGAKNQIVQYIASKTFVVNSNQLFESVNSFLKLAQEQQACCFVKIK